MNHQFNLNDETRRYNPDGNGEFPAMRTHCNRNRTLITFAIIFGKNNFVWKILQINYVTNSPD